MSHKLVNRSRVAIFGAMVALCVLLPVAPRVDAAQPLNVATYQFPPKAIGTLSIALPVYPFSPQSLGQAQGKVVVPAGAFVTLRPSVSVLHDPHFADLIPENIAGLDFEGLEADNKIIAAVAARCKKITLLNLNDTLVDDGIFDVCATLPNLQALYIDRADITGNGLSKLSACRGLQSLSLMSTPFRAANLAAIKGLPLLHYLNLRRTSTTDADMAIIGKIASLSYLNIGRTKVTDRGLSVLKNLPRLENLGLEGNQITDRGLAEIAAIPSLTYLGLESIPTDLTAAGFGNLKNSRKLARIDVQGTKIDDKALLVIATACPHLLGIKIPNCRHLTDAAMASAFSKLPQMQNIVASGTDFSHKTAAAVGAHCRGLQTLDVTDTPLSDDGVKALSTLANLHILIAANTQVTDAGLKYIAKLPTLKELNLNRTSISDAGIKYLLPVRNLSGVALVGTNVTSRGLQLLRQTHPALRVSAIARPVI